MASPLNGWGFTIADPGNHGRLRVLRAEEGTLCRSDRELKRRPKKAVLDNESAWQGMRRQGTACPTQVYLGPVCVEGDHEEARGANQGLRHTLTEQAVLKRMAAEGKDPFVVKL